MKNRQILEIGHGGLPIGSTLDYFLSHRPPCVEYHGIDFSPQNAYSIEELFAFFPIGDENSFSARIKRLKEEIVELKPDNFFLYDMDARRIDFERESFDEVHMHYLVTQPDVQEEDINKIVSESYRVLKPRGNLIITGELSGNMFKEHSEGHNTALKAVATQPFSRISESVDDLKDASVFYETIKMLLECRSKSNEGKFLILGLK